MFKRSSIIITSWATSSAYSLRWCSEMSDRPRCWLWYWNDTHHLLQEKMPRLFHSEVCGLADAHSFLSYPTGRIEWSHAPQPDCSLCVSTRIFVGTCSLTGQCRISDILAASVAALIAFSIYIIEGDDLRWAIVSNFGYGTGMVPISFKKRPLHSIGNGHADVYFCCRTPLVVAIARAHNLIKIWKYIIPTMLPKSGDLSNPTSGVALTFLIYVPRQWAWPQQLD
jgi:hypothetical protein